LLRAGNAAFYNPEISLSPDKDHYKLGTGRMLMYSTGIGAYIRNSPISRRFILYYIIRKMFVAHPEMMLALIL
jgi:hypothetical protein